MITFAVGMLLLTTLAVNASAVTNPPTSGLLLRPEPCGIGHAPGILQWRFGALRPVLVGLIKYGKFDLADKFVSFIALLV